MEWYEFASALLVACIGSNGLWNWIINRKKKKSADNRLLLGLAYSEIINRAEKYIERGCIDTDEYHELYHYLYEPYKEMGGNGTAEKLMEAVKKLPSKTQPGQGKK